MLTCVVFGFRRRYGTGPGQYLWEVAELVRKLALTSLVLFFSAGSPFQCQFTPIARCACDTPRVTHSPPLCGVCSVLCAVDLRIRACRTCALPAVCGPVCILPAARKPWRHDARLRVRPVVRVALRCCCRPLTNGNLPCCYVCHRFKVDGFSTEGDESTLNALGVVLVLLVVGFLLVAGAVATVRTCENVRRSGVDRKMRNTMRRLRLRIGAAQAIRRDGARHAGPGGSDADSGAGGAFELEMSSRGGSRPTSERTLMRSNPLYTRDSRDPHE